MNTIGTPLSPCATRVMLLGAGELGKEVVIALQRLGVEVIAVDRYENAPGHQVAHRSHVINMTDGAQLRALIERERPHLVVPEIEAIATPTLIELEKRRAGHGHPDRTCRLADDEPRGHPAACCRRARAADVSVPVREQSRRTAPRGRRRHRLSLHRQAGDVVVGQGTIEGRRPTELEAAWEYAASGGRVDAGRVIVEGLIRFDYEITLLTVRAREADGSIRTHFCEPIGHVQVAGDYVESWQPQAMSAAALARSRDIAERVTANLGGTGIFGVELFVAGDDVWFSEVSPRPHDTGMVTMATQHQSEFELHARAILGLPVDTALRNPGASAVIYGGLEADGVVFDGVADALRVPDVDLRLFGKPQSFKKRRMGVALARAVDTDEARAKAKLAASKVRPRAA
jgi:phosphoribosylglycinamide formyltransferase 2